jgi:hypothetical protein
VVLRLHTFSTSVPDGSGTKFKYEGARTHAANVTTKSSPRYVKATSNPVPEPNVPVQPVVRDIRIVSQLTNCTVHDRHAVLSRRSVGGTEENDIKLQSG